MSMIGCARSSNCSTSSSCLRGGLALIGNRIVPLEPESDEDVDDELVRARLLARRINIFDSDEPAAAEASAWA